MVKCYSEAPAEESMERRQLVTKGTSCGAKHSYDITSNLTDIPIIQIPFQINS